MKPDFYVASLSDIHLGHLKTSSLHITTNLGRAFPDVESTHKLDAMIFGGDLFDRLLSLNQVDVPQILEWAGHLLTMCEKHKIHAIFMEGTPSHDWGQNRLLEMLNRMGFGSRYFHYVKDLSIVYFDDLDINVLFVPDEWRPEPDDTWLEVRTLLMEKGLEQVDFTILHGVFDYQLPEHIKAPIHVTERYQKITKHYVFGAHVHTPSVRGNVLVNGSFDRLAHGEEEAKGHWRVKFPVGKAPIVKFHENTHAKIYKTIDCSGLTLVEALERIGDLVTDWPDDSHVRIKAAKTDPVLASFDVLRKRFPEIHWSSKATEIESVQKNLLVDLRSTFSQVQITPDNISELLMRKVSELTNDPTVLERCQQRMTEFI